MMAKDFSKDLIRYLPSKVIPGLFGILSIPLFTTLFNPIEYGQYILVISTISVLSILVNDWIGTAIIRFYPEYQSKSEITIFNGTIVRITIVSVIFITLTTFTILFISRSTFKDSLYIYMNIGLLILAFGTVFDIMMQVLVAKRKVNQYSFFSIWRQCICILIGFFIVAVLKMGVEGMLLGIVIGIVFVIPIFFRLTFEHFEINSYSKRMRQEFMRYGFPLVVTNLFAWILALSDRYIIEYYRGSHEVGLYSLSYSLTDRSIMLIVSLIIIASQPIVMTKWEKEGVEQTKIFITHMTKYYLIITLPAAVGLSLISKPIIEILASQEFLIGYKIMPMVAISIFLFGLQRNFQLSLLFFKKTRIIMYLVLTAGIINLIGNLILVPKYGFISAAYTTLFSYFIFAFLTILVSRKYLVWKFPFDTLFKVLVSTLLMSVVVLYVMKFIKLSLPFSLIFSVVAGVLAYFILLILMNELDINILKRIFS